MKTITMILCLFAVSAMASADQYNYVRPFGRGYIARSSNGGTMITQQFGSGFIARETHRGGSATYIGTPFGSGYIVRSTGRGVRLR